VRTQQNCPKTARGFVEQKAGANFLKTGRRRAKNGGGKWAVAPGGDTGIRIYVRAVNSFNVSNM
jgi:hypothetical protein